LEKAPEISVVSKERIQEELSKILSVEHAALGISLLQDSGLLRILLPQVDGNSAAIRFKGRHFNLDQAYAALFLETPKDSIIQSLKNLRCSNDVISRVIAILEFIESLDKIETLRLGAKELILHDKIYNKSLRVFESNPVNESKSELIRQMKARNRSLPNAFLTGNDLKNLGIQPGPQLGKILEEAYLLQLEGVLGDKSAAEDWVRSQHKNKK